METHLLRLLSCFTGFLLLQQVSSWKIEVPTMVTAHEGSCVEVPCHTQPHHRVIWYQYDSIYYPKVYDGHSFNSVTAQFTGRTSVVGNATEGDCTLRINDVRRADSGLRVYVWVNPDVTQSQKFHHQTVTISVVEKKAPVLSIQKDMVDGDIFQASCSISHSCPSSAPSLRWEISPFPENSTLVISQQEVRGQWLYIKKLQGRATYKLHKSKVTCTAQFPSFTTESKQTTLNVLYKPVTVTLRMEKEPVIEGHSVIVECVANSNPHPYMYSWLRRQMGQNYQINSSQAKISFKNITQDTSLSCIAHNTIGVGLSDWLYLDVGYVPVILSDSTCHLAGKALRCVCQAEASPTASIYWTIDGNDTLPSSFTSVSTNKKNIVSAEINGLAQRQPNVSCIARNSLGSDTKLLPLHYTLEPNKFLPLLLALMAPGSALLLGCAMFIYRRYPRYLRCPVNRPQISLDASNTDITLRPQNFSDNVQQEQIYENTHRSQRDEDAQARVCRPDTRSLMRAEENRKSSRYENFVKKTPRPTTNQQYQNNPRTAKRVVERQQNSQGMHLDMEPIYLNH